MNFTFFNAMNNIIPMCLDYVKLFPDKPVSKSGGPVGPDGKKLKPCCACPETKQARDACIIEKGEEHCSELIEAHKQCMRNLGFNI